MVSVVETTTVHRAIGNIIHELEGIGKNQRNKDQGYAFRGVDDVLKALHPLLGKHGVFIVPNVIAREVEERQAKSGAVGRCTYLHVEFTVYGPAGDSLTLSTWGEGLDYGDKSTNKALTSAFKYALFELFAICDPIDDGDNESPEPGDEHPIVRRSTLKSTTASEAQVKLIQSLMGKIGVPDDDRDRLEWASFVVKHEVTSLDELSSEDTSTVIDALKVEVKGQA